MRESEREESVCDEREEKWEYRGGGRCRENVKRQSADL